MNVWWLEYGLLDDFDYLDESSREFAIKTIEKELKTGSETVTLRSSINKVAKEVLNDDGFIEKLLEHRKSAVEKFVAAKVYYYKDSTINKVAHFGRWIAMGFSTAFGAIRKGNKMVAKIKNILAAKVAAKVAEAKLKESAIATKKLINAMGPEDALLACEHGINVESFILPDLKKVLDAFSKKRSREKLTITYKKKSDKRKLEKVLSTVLRKHSRVLRKSKRTIEREDSEGVVVLTMESSNRKKGKDT